MSNYQKHIHHNIDLEAVIVGICLYEIEAFMSARTMIQPEHFYHDGYKSAWQLMNKMWDDGIAIDLITVTQKAYQSGFIQEMDGNPAYFLTLAVSAVNTSAHLTSHCLMLRELYVARELLRIQMEAPKNDLDPLEAMLLTKASIEKALELNVDDDWMDMSHAIIKLQAHMQEMNSRKSGVLTGFSEFDKYTFGLQPGALCVLGARPSVGKSAFATSLAINSAKLGNKVGIISLEMPAEQVVGRISSIYSDIEFFRIYRNKFSNSEEELIAYRSMSDMAGLPIFFSDKTHVTAGHIRAKALKLKNRQGLDLLIIDYLQLIDSEGKRNENREREVAKLSRSLKLLALDLKIPILVLAQLNRESETTGNKIPKLSQLRESGALEQDADIGMILTRDESEAVLHVQKHRNGETFASKLSFDGFRMMFSDCKKETFSYEPDNPRNGIVNNYSPF